MNTISRIITGISTILFSIWFIIFVGFIDGPKIDYSAILLGIFILIIGFFIFFNKKEDDIEKIKGQNNKNF